MECDGLKQSLLVDKDGSFLGKPGAILPEAEFEWDGDKRRGLGDYRLHNRKGTQLTKQSKIREPMALNLLMLDC